MSYTKELDDINNILVEQIKNLNELIEKLIEENKKLNEKKSIVDENKCRELKKCLRNGDMIRHTYKPTNHTMTGIYDSKKDKIICGIDEYKSLNQFAGKHIEVENPNRTTSVNAWKECETKSDWVSMYDLPLLK